VWNREWVVDLAHGQGGLPAFIAAEGRPIMSSTGQSLAMVEFGV
jgi:hypothetical protein